jgi:adenine/guanine phosphoribosyltransferase-like PRPP-binding protein
LIDDVMTTGATLGSCARALKKAGAKSVAVLALARVDRRFLEQADLGKRKGPV